MITLESSAEYAPAGKALIKHHGQSEQPKKSKPYSQLWPSSVNALADLENELTEFSLSNHQSRQEPKENWILRECEHGEEELFTQGRTVIHSRTDPNGHFHLLKCYTLEVNIQKTLWTRFLNEDDEDSSFSAICTLDCNNIEVFNEDGNHYPFGIPFQVSDMHSSNFGLLLERNAGSAETISEAAAAASLPLLFALVNPLKDVTPVIFKFGSNSEPDLGFLTAEEKLELVGVCKERSLCLFYHREQELHSIWFLRMASDQEVNLVSTVPRPSFCAQDENEPSFTAASVLQPPVSLSNRPTSVFPATITASPTCSPNTRQAFHKQNSFNGSSPSSSINPIIGSPSNLTLSSLRSVRLAASPASAGLTRQLSGNDSLLGNQSSSTAAARIGSPRPLNNISFATIEPTDEVCEPIYPELCVEQLWLEPANSKGPRATKTFLTADLIGNHYLAYLIGDRQQLKLVRLEESNNNKKRLIFGAFSVLPAKDAEPLPSLQMMLVLDTNGTLLLYSGLHRLTVLHLQHYPFSLCPIPSASGYHHTSGHNVNSSTAPIASVSMFSDSFLQDTSQLAATSQAAAQLAASTNRPANAVVNPRLSLSSMPFSPILRDRTTSNTVTISEDVVQIEQMRSIVIALKDPVRNRITLEESGGSLHRVTIPPVATCSIVKMCLDALKDVLPKELSLKTLGRWYTMRNSPGVGHLNVDEEMRLFQRCIFSLCGYDLLGQAGFHSSSTDSTTAAAAAPPPLPPAPVNSKMAASLTQTAHAFKGFGKCLSPSKKQRVQADDEQGTDDDWTAMQNIITNDRSNNYFLLSSSEESFEVSSSPGNTRKSLSELKHGSLSFERCNSLISSCLIGCSGDCDSPSVSAAASAHVTSTPGRSTRQSTVCGAQRLPVSGDALLFPYMPSVLVCFHLILEEIKLDSLLMREMQPLVELLYLLAVDLRLGKYVDSYVEQNGGRRLKDERSMICTSDRKQLIFPTFLPHQPPCVLSYLRQLQNDTHDAGSSSSSSHLQPFPYIPDTTIRVRQMILLYRCFGSSTFSEKSVLQPITKKKGLQQEQFQFKNASNNKERIVLCLDKLEMEKEQLHTLPSGVAIPIWDAIFSCKRNPSAGWSQRAYNLIGRNDLLALEPLAPIIQWSRSSGISEVINGDNDCKLPIDTPPPALHSSHTHRTDASADTFEQDADGFSQLNPALMRLLFPNDQRVTEACNMLQSSKPVRVSVQQRPGVTDQEFMEEQEKHLYQLCTRTMALCVGRGMCTLRTYRPIIAETFPIPKLCLSGRAPPRNTPVELSNMELPAQMNSWPLFHNGVAAGLRVASSAVDAINSTWIIYNKPKISMNQSMDNQNEHAGFLLALGLNGHICRLSMMNIHDYLCMGNELTRVALLLGLAAAKRGTMDLFVVKILSIHVEALLPPTSTELDVPPVAQVAAVLGIGLLYQASGQRHIAEVLLGEIGRPPGPEMEHYIDRESYALAAGLAFGLVTLGKGNQLVSLVSSAESVSMADQLCNYMIGGHKRPMSGLQKDKYRTPSYQIREGDYVNAHVTSPGATLALGMMFFATENATVAKWLSAPDTQHLLEAVRPDLLLLRTLAKGLVMWSQVRPNKAWIDSHVPTIVVENALRREGNLFNTRIDYETMSQAYCNIVSGACMALALRYAGSADPDAFKTVMLFTKMFINLTNQPTVADQAGRFTIESCLNVLVLSLSMIMAGTGNLEVLKICRFLRSRVNQTNIVLYGSQMATHMALGLLFLGGCRYTLSTSPAAVAAMICAFFPKFPIHSSDNRYHLQAFRHLYVLAAEPRLVIPRDIANGRYVYVDLKIKYNNLSDVKNKVQQMRAPCFLPELNLIDELTISDNRYWKITFRKDKNWDMLSKFLSENGVLFVKQKVGCLPYQEDPHGFKSIHSQCVMKDAVHGWSHDTNGLSSFSSDPIVLNFARLLLIPRAEARLEAKLQHKLAILLFNCASNETVDSLAALIQTIKIFYCDRAQHTTGPMRQHCLGQLHLLTDDHQRWEILPNEFFQGLRMFVEQSIHSNGRPAIKHK